MIFRTPEYYGDFCCIADKCRDSCCIGWEIEIDPETSELYRNTDGAIGERLRENIRDNCFVLTDGERCPFLNEHGLCDIYRTLGEESLCQICSDHPRYFEWFGSVKEGGIGLCCEEAARVILSGGMGFSECEVPDEDCSGCDSELFELLLSARELILLHLRGDDLSTAVCSAVDFADELQENIDNGVYALPEWRTSTNHGTPELSAVLGIFTELEPIDESWQPYIRKCIAASEGFRGLRPEHTEYLRRIAVYFIFRYFLKGTFDGEIISRVRLAALSTFVIGYLWDCRERSLGSCGSEDCAVTAKDYSKEVEYSEENLAFLCDAFYERECLSAESIKALFHLEGE